VRVMSVVSRAYDMKLPGVQLFIASSIVSLPVKLSANLFST